jgi:2-polyprenyl-6-methoxyphenol hydroxylase-like FAD-dependent oxidoreductase
LLESLVGGIQDQKKLLVNKNITDVIHSADKVTVKCADGTTYDGDILVGADGVRSKTRQALWKIAEKENPMEVEKDREGE